MGFGYPTKYSNGLNSPSQLRRSTDMIYQRGSEYEVILTGDSYQQSLILQVELYSDDTKVGMMSIVPYNVSQSGSTYEYKFHIRPYDYFSNYIQSEHYKYYWLNDWYTTNESININRTYKNKIKTNVKYKYQYYSGITFTGETSYNDYNHYTDIPTCAVSTGFTASGFTNTGKYFDLIGGSFQMNDKYILPNFDQQLGSVVGSGITINTFDLNRSLSPMNQYMMTYPSVPEASDTGRFLTDAPRVQVIQENENFVLSFLNGQSADRQVIEADFAVFEFYDEGNNLIDYFEQELNFSGTTYASPTGTTDTLQIYNLPCGPKDISNIFSTIDFSNVAYYRVQLFYSYPTNLSGRTYNGAVGPISESFYFYLYDNCLPEDTRVVFLNERGGYDYYTFTAFRQDTKKITRQTYDNRYYSTSQQSPDRDFGRTVKTFDTNVDREFVLESDYLSVPYANWLEQLFLSPQVYEVREDFISPLDRQDKVYKDLRPIQILSTEVETITKKHRKLNRYRITCKYADGYFVNRGF